MQTEGARDEKRMVHWTSGMRMGSDCGSGAGQPGLSPAASLISCVTLGKLLTLSVPHFPYF